MTKSFSELRQQSSNIDKIAKQLKDSEGKKNYDDNRFWKAALDKAGNGQADIRFLPAPQGEQLSYVKYFSHNFKGLGGWFIENCPTTLGLPCPVCEDNGVHWNEGEDGQKFVRTRQSKRKLHYVTNVLVLKDPANPENEGKVFLFTYGAKIHKKYADAISPPFAGDKAYLPYDLWAGANFRLRISKVAGFANFDQSSFESQGPVSGNDADLEAIWKSEYPLAEFVDPEKKFKPYADLKKRLDKALGGQGQSDLGGKTIEESLQSISAGRTVSAPVEKAVADDADEELESIDISSDDVESLRDLIK